MNAAQKLHNAARHYCIDRHTFWCSKYESLTERGEARTEVEYSAAARDIYPRYLILAAILTDVERMDPDYLPPESELRELLVLAGHTAESIFTKGQNDEIEAAAIAQESREFERAILDFKPEDLAPFEILPYRRVLSEKEVEALWARVKPRWGADGNYFYPLTAKTAPDLHAFDTGLRRAVSSRGTA